MPRSTSVDGPDPVDIAVGARIRIRRRWLGLSQTELADALGITFQQVQKYEHGRNRVAASMLVRAAAKLQTTVAALIGEDGQAPVEPVLYAQLATPGATQLLGAFAAFSNGETRRAVLLLANRLATGAQRKAKAGGFAGVPTT